MRNALLCLLSIVIAKHLKLPQEEQEYSEAAARLMIFFYETCLGMIIDRRLGLDDNIKYLFMFVLYLSSDKEFQIFILSPPSLMKL